MLNSIYEGGGENASPTDGMGMNRRRPVGAKNLGIRFCKCLDVYPQMLRP
ncbi:MAG TPA: hypothetical protein V6D12_02435 [Candidatus Obscuribacterales bacterium]